MQFQVLTRNARNLARSAAVVAIAGVAAGCSSDVMRFQDDIFTSAAPAQPPQVASAPQAYPGQYGGQYGSQYPNGVDAMSTGSVQQPAARGNGRRPTASVGQGGQQVASASQPYPGGQSYPANRPYEASQPFPTAPSSGGVQRQALATPPAQAPQVNAAVQQPFPQQPQPQPQAQPVIGQAPVSGQPGQRVPMPMPTPAERTAVLPQVPRVNERASAAAVDTAPQQNAAAGRGVYTVASGDTLSSIARRNGTTTTAIKQANGLDGGILRIGQKLTIPAGQGAAVAASPQPPAAPRQSAQTASVQPAPLDTRPTGSTEPAAPVAPAAPQARQAESVIQEATRTAAVAPDATGIGRMRWPARGRVISGFGSSSGGKRNDGIDISLPEGTPVKAAENGVVIYAGDGLKEFGNTVLVRHENGLVTVYGHASQVKVKRGDTVRRGQDIALSGLSGNADQPKLHFEVRKDSAPVDPGKYLE